MNKIFLTGRTTKEIETRYTPSGIPVVQFILAVTRDYKNANGEYESDFINCVAYKHNAEALKNWVEKGDKIGIEGHLQTRKYQNKEGKTVYVSETIVEKIEFLQPRKKEENVSEIEPKKEESDPFAEFGNEITLTDDMLPF